MKLVVRVALGILLIAFALSPSATAAEPKGVRLKRERDVLEEFKRRKPDPSDSSMKEQEERVEWVEWQVEAELVIHRLGLSDYACLTDSDTGTKSCHVSGSSPRWVADFGETQWRFDTTLYFFKGRFYEYNLEFNPGAFGFLMATLSQRLGKPTARKRTVVQNRAGASFDQEIVRWDMPNTTVHVFSPGPATVTEGTMVVSYKPIKRVVPSAKPGRAPF